MRLQPKAQGRSDLEHGGELRVAVGAQGLVERLTGKSGLSGEQRHSLGAGDHAERVGDRGGIAFREGVLQPLEVVYLFVARLEVKLQRLRSRLIRRRSARLSNIIHSC